MLGCKQVTNRPPLPRINDYVAHPKYRGKKTGRQQHHKESLRLLRKALKHAFKWGLLDKMPMFPKIKKKDNPREWFT